MLELQLWLNLTFKMTAPGHSPVHTRTQDAQDEEHRVGRAV